MYKKYWIILALLSTLLVAGCGSTPDDLATIKRESGVTIEVLAEKRYVSPNGQYYTLVKITDKEGKSSIQLIR